MLINIVKTVICFYLCFSVTTSYIYNKNSDRTQKKQYPKTIASYHDNSNNYKQSRYSKFDKVMTRINKLIVEDDVSNDGAYRIRHKGWGGRKVVSTTPSTTTTTEMDLFETYGELENEDEFDDYEDSLDDEDDELDYADEDGDPDSDPFFDSLDEDVQAEEPTEKPSSTLPPVVRPVSRLTEWKWNTLGTREKVQESMRQQLNLKPSKEQLKVKAVIEHYARVNQQSKCLTPLPRVISVQQEHPDPTRTYIPACTVLHRCAEDSGCCKRDTRCQYKTRVLVSLYFYAKYVGQDHNTIERLDFYNHTECECKDKTEYIPLESEKDPDFGAKSLIEYNLTAESTNTRCNCPKPFQSFLSLQKCSCDCDKSDQDCITLKKGKEHFSMTNRICIQDNQCGLPACEYGAYMYTEGKCPSKQDRLEEFRNIRFEN
ncbi:uncharacterized protein LOC114329749 [Diabrotica virgifera virgifera]|uniref:Platelet-derived growth factor (PDGF) family profile domain-containing protein n=1 Tax=Diabrotica virgifera virgifera TaxID=50390 RepID=A0ABM5JJH7_DIAVI|nr:uncharacterized protein LOC114329749 [Diabrotica virgifera virgifera]XP_050498092.1 uncharacterized protein LOC114329749 [Diabrotica virgifera virgifera]